eukprot:5241021-Prymnesium_polylepis.1
MSAVAILDLYMAKQPMAARPPALVMHVFDTASADSAPYLRTLTSPEQDASRLPNVWHGCAERWRGSSGPTTSPSAAFCKGHDMRTTRTRTESGASTHPDFVCSASKIGSQQQGVRGAVGVAASP